MLLLWLVLVFSEHVSSLSRISEPRFKAVNFAEEKKGRLLNGSVIKEMQVDAEGECRLWCVDEEQCRSYNFGLKKHKAGNFLCQLNGSDKSVGFGNFTKDDNFKYRGMEVIKVKEEWSSVKARGGTPYNGQYGKAPPERGTFFRLQGKSVIWVCERTQRANRWIVWLYEVEKTFYFCDWFLFLKTTVHLQQLKGISKVLNKVYERGTIC